MSAIPDRISNSEDIIDSRDILARMEWLEDTEDEEEREERATLTALSEEAEGYVSDWRHGATLIRGSYFTEYAQELAEDIGAISRDAQWPLSHIDWDGAADALKIDYTELDFEGVTYYVRMS